MDIIMAISLFLGSCGVGFHIKVSSETNKSLVSQSCAGEIVENVEFCY